MATDQKAVNINPLSEINPDKVVVIITQQTRLGFMYYPKQYNAANQYLVPVSAL